MPRPRRAGQGSGLSAAPELTRAGAALRALHTGIAVVELGALGYVGDPTPLFELILPPRAAKLAVPALTAVAVGGLALTGVRAR